MTSLPLYIGFLMLSTWSYEIQVGPQFRQLDVQLCAETLLPESIQMAVWKYRDAIEIRSPGVESKKNATLRFSTKKKCLDYSVNTKKSMSLGRESGRFAGGYLIGPDAWLFRPPKGLEAKVRFDVPKPYVVSTPWKKLGDAQFLIHPNSYQWRLTNAFTPSEPLSLKSSPGCAFFAINLTAQDSEYIRAIAQDGVSAVSAMQKVGTHCERMLIFVPGFGAGVSFGMTLRGGGGAVLLYTGYVNEGSRKKDWVVTHELSHFLHPYLSDDMPWLYEGLSTYLEPVGRARSGRDSAKKMWQRIYDGLESGLVVHQRRTLKQSSELMHSIGAYRRVYWHGALIALKFDLRLRQKFDYGLDRILERVLSGRRLARSRMSNQDWMNSLKVDEAEIFEAVCDEELERREALDLKQFFKDLGFVLRRNTILRVPQDGPAADIMKPF